jgi:hypothetical protein
VIYRPLPRLFADLALAHADGSYIAVLRRLARFNVLVLDDWGLGTVTDRHRHDLLEIHEDRDGTRSTVIPSQLPRERWHDYLGDPTVADSGASRAQATGIGLHHGVTRARADVNLASFSFESIASPPGESANEALKERHSTAQPPSRRVKSLGKVIIRLPDPRLACYQERRTSTPRLYPNVMPNVVDGCTAWRRCLHPQYRMPVLPYQRH